MKNKFTNNKLGLFNFNSTQQIMNCVCCAILLTSPICFGYHCVDNITNEWFITASQSLKHFELFVLLKFFDETKKSLMDMLQLQSNIVIHPYQFILFHTYSVHVINGHNVISVRNVLLNKFLLVTTVNKLIDESVYGETKIYLID